MMRCGDMSIWGGGGNEIWGCGNMRCKDEGVIVYGEMRVMRYGGCWDVGIWGNKLKI